MYAHFGRSPILDVKDVFEYDLHARTCKDQNEMALHSTLVYLSQDSHNCH